MMKSAIFVALINPNQYGVDEALSGSDCVECYKIKYLN